MNFYAITGLANLATSVILGIFAFAKNPKKSKNISFFLLTIAIAIWSFSYFVWQVSSTHESALFWTRMLSVGSTLIPILYLQWVLFMLDLLRDKKRLIFLIFGYLVTAVFLFFSFSNLFVREVIQELGFEFWPKAGPLYTAYLIFSYVGLVGYALVELIRSYFKRTGIIRYQIKYIILATIISFIGGATNFFLWYDIPVPPVGNILVALYTIILFYAMIKYRLMDIRIVFQKFIIFTGLAGIVYGSYYLTTWFYNNFLGGVHTTTAYLFGLIVAPLFVGVFFLLTKFIKLLTSKYLFFSLYNYQETIARLADDLNTSIDLDKIVNSIVNTIKKTMNLNRAGVLLISKEKGRIRYKIAKVIGFNETNGISLVQDNFLTKYLEKTKKALIREELYILAKESKNQADKKNFEKLAKNSEKIEASLCLPLISGSNLIGIIVLGFKNSGDAYSKEDLQLLEMLSRQAAIAIENARLYKKVDDLSHNLQEKVDEQTKELREQKEEIEKAYQVEKQAHEDLVKLDEAKTNFMLVTQHHLRTPLSITMGFLDLLLSGHFGKMPKKVLEIIKKSQQSIQKEIEVVDDLLNVSAFQLGHGYVHLQSFIPIKNMLEEIVADLVPVAEKKRIYLKFESEDDIPEITVDGKQIKMALQNIVDNAIKYTKKGGVVVKINSEKEKIKIEIKDTGIGMNENDKKYLFDKPFQRSEEAWSANATGKGIGVYLSAQIIKAHGGKIKADSAGKGKGSTLNIELPVDATPFANKKQVSLASGKLITKS